MHSFTQHLPAADTVKANVKGHKDEKSRSPSLQSSCSSEKVEMQIKLSLLSDTTPGGRGRSPRLSGRHRGLPTEGNGEAKMSRTMSLPLVEVEGKAL